MGQTVLRPSRAYRYITDNTNPGSEGLGHILITIDKKEK